MKHLVFLIFRSIQIRKCRKCDLCVLIHRNYCTGEMELYNVLLKQCADCPLVLMGEETWMECSMFLSSDDLTIALFAHSFDILCG